MPYGSVKIDTIVTSTKTVTVDNLMDGTAGSVTSAMIADGAIVNADVNASAAIAFSKLAALTAGNVLVGNASNVATSVALSGDVTLTNAGVATVVSGSTSTAGKLQLTDSTSSTSTTTAATPNAVKSAYDLANGKASLSTAQTFTAAQRGTVSAIGAVAAGTTTLDFATANNFSMSLPAGGTVTLGNPSNLVAGQSGVITITQNSGTAALLTYGGYWKFQGGAPAVSTTLSSVNTLVYFVESSTRISAVLRTNTIS